MKLQQLFKPKDQANIALIMAASLTVGAVLAYSALRTLSPPTIDASASASAASQVSLKAVSASGYLEPKGEVIKLSAPASAEGARIDQLLVEQGDKVEAGQVIATLNTHDRFKAALEQAKQQVLVAQAKLTKIKAGAKAGDIDAQAARFQQNKAELEGQIATQPHSLGFGA